MSFLPSGLFLPPKKRPDLPPVGDFTDTVEPPINGISPGGGGYVPSGPIAVEPAPAPPSPINPIAIKSAAMEGPPVSAIKSAATDAPAGVMLPSSAPPIAPIATPAGAAMAPSGMPPAPVPVGVPQNTDPGTPPRPGPPPLRDHSTDAPRGTGGNIKYRLEHAGKAALLGLATGGIGGAIAGGIGGAVSPKFADKMEQNLITIPKYRADQEWQDQQEAASLGREHMRVSTENIGADNARDQERIRMAADERDRQRQYQTDRLKETQRHNQELEKKTSNVPHTQKVEGGYIKQLNPSTGRWEPALDEKGRPMRATEREPGQINPVDRERFRREDERTQRAAENDLDKQWTTSRGAAIKADREVTVARAKAEAVRAKAARVDARGQSQASPEEVKAAEAEWQQAEANAKSAWEEAAGIATTLKEDYGRDAGIGRGGYAFVNKRKPTPLGSRASGEQQQASGGTVDIKEALRRYDAVPTEKKEKARQAFIKQRGIDPDTIKP